MFLPETENPGVDVGHFSTFCRFSDKVGEKKGSKIGFLAIFDPVIGVILIFRGLWDTSQRQNFRPKSSKRAILAGK